MVTSADREAQKIHHVARKLVSVFKCADLPSKHWPAAMDRVREMLPEARNPHGIVELVTLSGEQVQRRAADIAAIPAEHRGAALRLMEMTYRDAGRLSDVDPRLLDAWLSALKAEIEAQLSRSETVESRKSASKNRQC